jgi:glucosamine--fructose-6-phosphate aminotransferase (isomerizing)
VAGELMMAEIRQQPDVLKRILSDGSAAIRAVGDEIRRRNPRFVLFVARGTSDHAALYCKYLVETRLCLPAGLASPSSMTLYDAHPVFDGVLLIAVSQSGASPDLVQTLDRARDGGAITLAVTNVDGSPLAARADYHLNILAGPERAVAATKTYTAQLLTLLLFVSAVADQRVPQVETLPDLAQRALDIEGRVAQVAQRYRFAEQIVTTARGYEYPTAMEAALKLMETSYLVAHAFSGADLLHGPMAMIDRGFPVLALASSGAGASALLPVLQRLAEIGADTLVVGNPEAIALGTVGLALPPVENEALAPIISILPLQLFAWYLARERRSDPDQPRGLRKVTETW